MRAAFNIVAAAVIITLMVGCAGNPASPGSNQLVVQAASNITGGSDRFLGEFQIIERNGEAALVPTRNGEADINATKYLSVTDVSAPLFLQIKNKTWEDDPGEADPKQGTRTYILELTNNTGLQIYDPWLILTDLGQKVYENPSGITSRAYFPSKQYASFSDASGTIKPHSVSGEVKCEVFFPKTEPTLAPITFAAYGSYPEDYIDVGEGSDDLKLWRGAYDAAGGRNALGIPTGKVEAYENFFIQRFPGGALYFSPTNGLDVLWIWNPIWTSYDNAPSNMRMGEIKSDIKWGGPSVAGTHFFYLTCGMGQIIAAIDGDFNVLNASRIWGPCCLSWNKSCPMGACFVGIPIEDTKSATMSNMGTSSIYNIMEKGIVTAITDGPNGGTSCIISEPVRHKWMSDKNFTSGDLGCATGGEWSHKSKASGANVSYVEFENGEIIRYANGSHQGEVWSICSGDWNCRLNWGGVDADMGFPVGEEYAWGTGTFQKFEKGGISFQYSIGSWWISGTIFDYWLNHGGMDGMGAAMGNEYDVWVDGVWHRAQDFTKGTLCRNMNTGQVTEGCPPALTNDFAGFPVSGYMSQISQDWNVYNYGWVGTHMGQDIGLSAGTPVYAMADGQVRHSQYHAPIGNHPDYGYCVIIEHTIPGYGSICSLYGHLASGIIGNGAVVKKGQQIGVIGTYEENGHNPEHLHFGLYPGPYSGTWIYWGYDPPGHVGETIRPSDFVNKY